LRTPPTRTLRTLWPLAAAVLLLAAGCSPLRALGGFASGPVAVDVPYGGDGDVALDVFAHNGPAAADAALRDVIVFFYGGGWQNGSKEAYRFVGSRLAEQGFVVVLPNYRHYPEEPFPAFVEDAAAAVAWVFEHAGDYGGDPARVFVMGHSAGAHIAALVHFDERYRQRAGASRAPCGFIGLSGPYDFLPLVGDELEAIFPRALRDDSQPINFVNGSEGPVLLVHGLQDNTVKPRNSAKLAEVIRQAGGAAELQIYDGRGHVGVLLSLSRPFAFLAPTLDSVTDFVRRQDCAG